uniref:Ubiquitinyl hydrolase 1 n=1 Tax=Macrostomum lignano TaxID=282301 RepID=A0A1I8FJZ7_9PLAT
DNPYLLELLFLVLNRRRSFIFFNGQRSRPLLPQPAAAVSPSAAATIAAATAAASAGGPPPVFAVPRENKSPMHWLVDLALARRFEQRDTLNVTIIASLLRPFGASAEVLAPSTRRPPENLEELRLKMILRVLQLSSFNGKMKALNELNKAITSVSYYQHRHRDPEGFLTPEKIAEWIQRNQVLSIVLKENLHQPQYVEKLEKLIRFMIKEKQLPASELLDKIWDAQRGKHEAIVKNVHDLLAKLAWDFSADQLDHLFVCFQNSWRNAEKKEREKLLELIRRLAEDDKEGIGSNRKLQWIDRTVAEMDKGDKWILPALKHIRDICCLFHEPPHQQYPKNQSQGYRNDVINKLNNTHNILTRVATNLVQYTEKASKFAKAGPSPSHGGRHQLLSEFLSSTNLRAEKLLVRHHSAYMDDINMIGGDYLWRLAIEGSDLVADKATNLLKEMYTHLGPKLTSKLAVIHEDFIQSCLDRLRAGFDTVSCVKGDPAAAAKVAEECGKCETDDRFGEERQQPRLMHACVATASESYCGCRRGQPRAVRASPRRTHVSPQAAALAAPETGRQQQLSKAITRCLRDLLDLMPPTIARCSCSLALLRRFNSRRVQRPSLARSTPRTLCFDKAGPSELLYNAQNCCTACWFPAKRVRLSGQPAAACEHGLPDLGPTGSPAKLEKLIHLWLVRLAKLLLTGVAFALALRSTERRPQLLPVNWLTAPESSSASIQHTPIICGDYLLKQHCSRVASRTSVRSLCESSALLRQDLPALASTEACGRGCQAGLGLAPLTLVELAYRPYEEVNSSVRFESLCRRALWQLFITDATDPLCPPANEVRDSARERQFAIIAPAVSLDTRPLLFLYHFAGHLRVCKSWSRSRDLADATLAVERADAQLIAAMPQGCIVDLIVALCTDCLENLHSGLTDRLVRMYYSDCCRMPPLRMGIPAPDRYSPRKPFNELSHRHFRNHTNLFRIGLSNT